MELQYSPRHSPGGTLHMLSPTHPHNAQVDGFSTIRQIRRSLSRSPSKPSRFALLSKNSPNGPMSPVPRSPSGLSRTFSVDSTNYESASKTTGPRTGAARTRSRKTSPNSPLRRALSDNTNQVNAVPRYSARRTSAEHDQENMDCSEDTVKAVPELRFDDPIKLDFSKPGPEKLLQPVMREHASPMKSSPLKRSDGVMNLEAATLGSPRSSKRRSLHGASSVDFSIFEQGLDGSHSDGSPSPEDVNEENGPVFSWSTAPTQSPQRRPFSLRKSTLSQRAGSGRKNLFSDSMRDSVMSPSLSRARSRFSLDGALPLRSPDMDSPSRRSNASDPPVLFPPPSQKPYQSAPKPHPLSHALTPSSSTSSVTEDGTTPTGEPPAAPLETRVPLAPAGPSERPRPLPGFSKSLPLGALRPTQLAGDSTEDSHATPAAYKMAKPLPQAFMSTGLISKRHRNIDDAPAALFASTHMPDTPSKKVPHIHFGGTPAPSALGKVVRPMHEFGSPSTPFNGRVSKISPESFGKGVNIFGTQSRQPHLTRKSSFLSIDGDDANSPTRHLDSQAIADDLPPTPTKSTSSTTRPQSKGKSNSLRSSLFGRRTSLGPDTFASPADREHSPAIEDECKLMLAADSTPCFRREKDADSSVIDDSPMPFITLTTSRTPSPRVFRSQSLCEPQRVGSPSPLAKRSLRSLPLLDATECAHAKPISATSTVTIKQRNYSPQTPRESFTPPDPSNLSISVENRAALPFTNSSSFPPATPTGPRGDSFAFSLGQSNAASNYFQNDVDTSLTSRFGQVTSFGNGEFSQVYKVEKPVPGGPAVQKRASPGSNVYAVKKSRRPYTGVKDRQRKMQEVEILRMLQGEEHIVQLVDHWESKNHLYIQTEYCENGNLKDFLLQTGFKGRLDDFRIWKILLELSKGVKSIHDANLIHLDLKPANVFIDWEGLLKIGDFGMASAWPAPNGIDGEGDREYIGPEVLSGRFDKPADVFSLGMIMLEIAGNIVLPDNGASWQRLRAGDLSDLPSLTWSSDSSLVRDDSGDPIELLNGQSNESLCTSQQGDDDLSFLRPNAPKMERSQELVQPPNFMVDPTDSEALERIVQWMICPEPDLRPSIDQLLRAGGVQWVEQRRRAGATVFEGTWGPADDVLNHGEQDVEMMDI